MKKLSGKRQALVGFTLFSMFFGAGNLIFPPGVGAQAGTLTWPAMLGMAFSAVGLPVLGVVAVARSGGLAALGNRVHPLFSRVFTILAYLSIGPCLAIPRTASTSFEMAVPPLCGAGRPPRAASTALFAGVFRLLPCGWLLRPEKLTDRLGKVMCPILILLIVVTFVGCLVNPLEGYGPPQDAAYAANPVAKGFLDGYQTMDTIAALVFGIIISLNIRAMGVEREEDVVKSTVRAGWIAGAMLLAVYSMLAHVGALSGGAFPGAANGAVVLTNYCSLPCLEKPAACCWPAIFCHCLLQCLCGVSSLLRRVFFPALAQTLLSGMGREVCGGKHGDRKCRAGPYPSDIRSSAGGDLPGGHCAHCALLLSEAAGGASLRLFGPCGGYRCVQRPLCAKGPGESRSRFWTRSLWPPLAWAGVSRLSWVFWWASCCRKEENSKKGTAEG